MKLNNRPVPYERINGIVRFLQPDDFSCGPTALQTILYYHGSNYSPGRIRRECRLTKNGSYEYDIVQAARRLDFKVRYRKRRIGIIREELDSHRPILCVRFDLRGYPEGHFSVIASYTKHYLMMADPYMYTKKRMRITRIRSQLGETLFCLRPCYPS